MPSERLPPVLTYRYERIDTPNITRPVSDPELDDAPVLDSREIDIERDHARQTLEDIRRKLDERARYYHIEELVLGVEKYIEADVYCRCAYQDSVDDVLDVDLTVIPEDVIRPVIPSRKRRDEYLEEGDDAE